MTENDTPRAEQVIPPGFRPLQFPQVVDLDKQTDSDDEPMIVAQGDLRVTAEALGSMELLAAILNKTQPGGSPIARQIADMARFWKHHVRLIGGMAAVVALALVGAVLPVGGTASAQAMEAPQPDPIAQTVRVVLGAAPVTVYVRATAYTPAAPGVWCGSVWTARGIAGRACAASSAFTIRVRIDPRMFPAGRTLAQVVDDSSDVAVGNVTFDARRPSKFGVGYFEDLGRGDLGVRVPVTLYSPALGRWVPQVQSPVQVQELVGRTWLVRATLVTNPPGLAVGIVHLGGGRHVIRVVRPAGRTVWSTTGQVHVFNLLTEPIDVN